MQIAYRESVTSTATETASLERKIGDTNHSVVVSLTVKPSDDTVWKAGLTKRPKFHTVPSKESTLAEKTMPRHHLIAVENGITSGLSKGIFCSYCLVFMHTHTHTVDGTSMNEKCEVVKTTL